MKNELDATTAAVHAADTAHLAHLADNAGWERRGVLQRLAQTRRLASEEALPRQN